MSEQAPVSTKKINYREMTESYEARETRKRMNERRQCKNGYKACMWSAYGCLESIEVPRAADNTMPNHEESCAYKSEQVILTIWDEVKRFQGENGVVPNLWETLVGVTHKFGPVYTWEAEQPVTTQEPLAFEAGVFWGRGPPPESNLYEVLLRYGHNSQRHPKNSNIVTISRQIIYNDHNPYGVQMVKNIQSKPISEEYPIVLPPSLDCLYTARNGYSALDVTPTFSFEDLCVDRGLTTVSIHYGNIRKLWLLWPPTEENEALFYPYISDPMAPTPEKPVSIFERIGPLLTGGLMIIGCLNKGLLIPPGWLHVAFTMRGGYLPRYIFSSMENVESLLRCFMYELCYNKNQDNIEYTLRFIQDSIFVVMRSTQASRVKEGIHSWVKLMNMAGKAAMQRHIGWSPEIIESTNDILEKLFSDDMIQLPEECSCGEARNVAESFHWHFLRHRLG